jgi:hypothetical protein
VKQQKEAVATDHNGINCSLRSHETPPGETSGGVVINKKQREPLQQLL